MKCPNGARDLSAAIECNPQLRAERFMDRWRALEAEGGAAGCGKAMTDRAEMIAGLRHDPAMHAELERRAPKLGLDRDRQQSVEQVLQRQIEMQRGRDRQQDRGLGR